MHYIFVYLLIQFCLVTAKFFKRRMESLQISFRFWLFFHKCYIICVVSHNDSIKKLLHKRTMQKNVCNETGNFFIDLFHFLGNFLKNILFRSSLNSCKNVVLKKKLKIAVSKEKQLLFFNYSFYFYITSRWATN